MCQVSSRSRFGIAPRRNSVRTRANGEVHLEIPLYGPAAVVTANLDRARIASEVVALYDSLRLPLLRYLISIGTSADHAEDVVQETFLRAYKHLNDNGLGRDSNLRAWVFRVAHNLAVNHKKRSERSRSGLGDGCGESLMLEDPSASPEAALARKERLQQINRVMAALSKRERQCLHLRAEGLRYVEIAAIAGVSVSTVAETLHRALKKLIS
jgi:RNA polymerase sigma-70 factor (ECF subfamily)